MKSLLLLFALFQFASLGFSQIVGDTLMKIVTPADHEMMDIDNDGDYDLVVVGYYDIVWYENEGNEEFGDANYIVEDITGHFGIEALDINGDGYMDFTAYYEDGTNRISWFENNADGTFTPHVITIIDGWEITYYFLDDDIDGDFDLIYSMMGDGVYRIPGNPDATFGPEEIIHDGSINYYRIYNTDFDNDGDRDLLMGTQDGMPDLSYLENLGGGSYAEPILILEALLQRPNIAEFADMDGDGDEDWILGFGYEYYGLKYYENTGEALADEYDFMESSGGGVAVGDMDLDGDLDIVGLFTHSQHKWIRGNGDGTFEEGEELPVDIWEDTGWLDALSSVHLYDFDADGDLEVYGETVQDYFYFMEYQNLFISEFNASGKIYADLNENGVWDDGEEGVDFPAFESDPDAETYYVYPNGDYFIGFPTEADISYTYAPVLPENWEISTPDADYTVLIDGITPHEDLDFGIYPTVAIDSIETDLIGAFPRCNDTINYWVNIDNYGTTRPGGIITLELDDSISYVSSAVTPDSVVAQNVYWSYDDLAWYDNYIFTVQVAMPDFLSEGEAVTSYLTTVVIDDGGTEVYAANDSLVQIIVCAYDPNDKVGFPYGVDEPGYISVDETYMDYTVRFQNTGSDTAFTVRIVDPIHENFNIETLEVLAKSHAMDWSINIYGQPEFLFEDIELPDSTTDFVGSQGFVKYRIYMDEGLPAGTPFENTAYIYFDANPSVETNTTLHTLYDCDTILNNVSMPLYICNGDSIFGTTDGFEVPSTTAFTWTVGGEVMEGDDFAYLELDPGEVEILVTASTGFCTANELFAVTVLSEIEPSELPIIPLCFGDSVEVFGTYQTVAGTYTETFLTEYGCDSTVIQEITPLAEVESTTLALISICAGESVEVFGELQTEAGTYSQTLETVEHGCDSIIFQEIAMYDITEVTINELTDDLLCMDEASIALTAEPAGGVFDGTGVDGETFDPAISGLGDYVVYYTFEDDNECTVIDSVSISVVDCLGNEEWDSNGITVYPNPFSDYTIVQFNRNFEVDEFAVILDLQGKQVRNYATLTGNQLKVEKGDLPQGVYLLQVLSADGGQIETVRLVVK